MALINDFLGILTPLMLLCAGAFFCFKLRFFHLKHPIKMFKTMTKRENAGGVSPIRALTLALAGTLGVGNIVGVASSIALGGYGSVLWMWVSAFVAMILKYAEIVLAMLYRKRDVNGELHGGAYYYIKAFFQSKGLKKVGSVLGGMFAILCLLNTASMGSIVQANAISSAFEGQFGIPLWVTGGAVAVVSLFIIMGNSERISAFTEKIVFVMSVGYVVVSLAALVIHKESVLPAFSKIFEDAFNVRSAGFGVMGFLFARSFRMGCMRGLMSNEAGCGTAPTAHATSNTKSPAKQGLLGIFEVFVDTILLCSLTALVIIVAGEGVLAFADNPMLITLNAYASLLGGWAGIYITVSVLLFGFATIVCWAHYGREALGFLCRSKVAGKIFVFVYSGLVFFGAVCSVGFAWELADLAIGLMTVINVVILCLMSGEVKRETEKMMIDYL